MDSKLDTFVSNSPQRLLKLAKRLFDNGFFNCYLSAEQFNLLNAVLYNPVITARDARLQLWAEFLDGNVNVEFYGDNENGNKNEAAAKNGDASSPRANDTSEGSIQESKSSDRASDRTTDKQDEANDTDNDSIELNLKSGVTSARNLAFKVRYLLWEQALDYYYATGDAASAEYEILEVSDDEEAGETKQNTEQTTAAEAKPARDEDDDYDDEDEDEDQDEEESAEKATQTEAEGASQTGTSSSADLKYNDDKELLIDVPISTITAPPAYPAVKDESIDRINLAPSLLGPSVIESDFDKRNELKLIRNFNKVYHSFENDQKNFVKRRKLEESDKKLASMNGSDDAKTADEEDPEPGNTNMNNLINFGGAANLSLKNLLSKIDRSREKLNLTDLELRNLVLDVRKNRSKWASDDKIGQEELYEACERVVLELRGFTEHSTAFLNKVSKREAPNYYQVIKRPMDLNTVMKKLKAFQYKNKAEFVEDLMLIWKNCLTYNSDPSHFIRGHALAMQKKTLSLTPLIPDITIRDRADVEREEAELHKDDEKEADEHVSKATRGGVSTAAKGGKAPKKGKKRSRSDDADASTSVDGSVDTGANGTPAPASTPAVVEAAAGDEPAKAEAEDAAGAAAGAAADAAAPDAVPTASAADGSDSKPEASAGTASAESAGAGAGATAPADETPAQAEENDDDEENDQQQQDDDDENGSGGEDLEFQTWTNLTSSARYRICSKRSELFKENKLQPDTQALSRTVDQMKNFSHYLGDEEGIIFNSNRLEYLDRNDHDEPYLIEYDVTGGIPSIPYQGVSAEAEEKEEEALVSDFLSRGTDVERMGPSGFVPSPDGLNKVINENIGFMQEIRRICFKISLIRQMQSQAFVHHTQMKPPEIETVKDVDIDPISRLANKDAFNSDVCYAALKRNVSKILMANGFESADSYCVDVLTQVAEDYMGNVIKSIKLHSESQSVNKIGENKSNSEILLLALLENGIPKPDALHTYVRETIQKQAAKLREIKASLTLLLKDMLRPGFQESLSEKAFSEDSEQYLTGDFANDIGDDFFGFRELGLDKEFGLLSQTIPLHLLHARLHNANLSEGQAASTVRYEDIAELEYRHLGVKDIPKQIGLLQPFYEVLAEKSRHFYAKLRKKEEDETGEVRPHHADDDLQRLVEDDELPNKQKNSRPKVPPTGKIPGVKKKLVEQGFFLKPEPAAEAAVPDDADADGARRDSADAPFASKDEFSSRLQFPPSGQVV